MSGTFGNISGAALQALWSPEHSPALMLPGDADGDSPRRMGDSEAGQHAVHSDPNKFVNSD